MTSPYDYVFYDWKFMAEEQYNMIESLKDVESIKSALRSIFGFTKNEKQNALIGEFQYLNFIFCKQQAFDGRKTTALLSILHDIFSRDMTSTSFNCNVSTSSDYFKTLLLKHSVERSPKSILIFTQDDISAIFSFVCESYYKNFSLYKYAFGKYMRMKLNQTMLNSVESPRIDLPQLADEFAEQSPP